MQSGDMVQSMTCRFSIFTLKDGTRDNHEVDEDHPMLVNKGQRLIK